MDKSDDKRAKEYNVSEDIRNKVEMFISLKKTADNFPDYWDIVAENFDHSYRLSRNMPFNDFDDASLNAGLCCV